MGHFVLFWIFLVTEFVSFFFFFEIGFPYVVQACLEFKIHLSLSQEGCDSRFLPPCLAVKGSGIWSKTNATEDSRIT